MQPIRLSKLLLSLLLGSLPALALASSGHMHEHDHQDSQKHFSVGQPGDPANISRTVDIIMDDNMRFEPAQLDVKAGKTVRFRVKNIGQLPHEMVIGTLDELQAHARQMREMPDMPHNESNAVALDAGEHGDLVWHFTQPTTLDFACLISGHLEAGMKGSIRVH